MSNNSQKGRRRILAAGIWVVLLAGAGLGLKYFVFPSQKQKLVTETGSSSQYREEIIGGHDLFPGYATLRSELMYKNLKSSGIKLTWEDDEADYEKRIKKLRDGDINIAVFTIDALITSSIAIGEWPPPATVIAVIDQTKGADGLVAWKNKVPTINALDHEDARIVAIPKSPAELISRVVVGQFSLPRLPDDWMIEADSSKEVLRMLTENKNKRYAYALWEPELSQAKEMDGVHVLLDSSKLDGLIVDVLVASREFVAAHPDLVQSVGEAYLRASYAYKNEMAELIAKDAGLNQAQAQKIADGIRWTNTMENFAHFGLVTGGQHIEDIIINITNVLVATGALPEQNPVRGTESNLYYDQMLIALQASGFHPARKINLLGSMAGMAGLDAIRTEDNLPALSNDEWNSLIGVGNIKVNRIAFGRGSSKINIGGRRELRDLADRLSSFPQYYLLVVGNSTAKGDAAANLALAQQRSDAVGKYLATLGVSINRVKAKAAPPTNKTTSSVSFVIGQRPY